MIRITGVEGSMSSMGFSRSGRWMTKTLLLCHLWGKEFSSTSTGSPTLISASSCTNHFPKWAGLNMISSEAMLYSCPVNEKWAHHVQKKTSFVFLYLTSFVFSEHEFEIPSLPFMRSGCGNVLSEQTCKVSSHFAEDSAGGGSWGTCRPYPRPTADQHRAEGDST